MTDSPPNIAENLARIEARIVAACERAGRARDEVMLLSVTKRRPLEHARELLRLGSTNFGENRIQEARERIPEMPEGISWHMIGHLQKNKAKYVPGLFQWIHSVDSIALAEQLNRAFEKAPGLPRLNVLLQFNVSGEEQKYGAEPDNAEELLGMVRALPRLEVRGLMCMAPHFDDPQATRPMFRQLRTLRDRLQVACNLPLPELSMGMSEDFEVAIEEGSTMVRVGSALFE